MTKLKFLVILGALTALAHATNGGVFPPEPPASTPTPVTTSVAPVTTSTKPPMTTTLAPDTTTKPTEPPTPKPPAPPSPKTTTAAPNTTTVAPNTTTVAPNTTTVAPKTTTVAPAPNPTPAPKPSPVPSPSIGTWRVNYTDNTSCIIAKMAMQIQVPYMTKDNKTMTGYVDVPVNATVDGQCGESSQGMNLSWDKDLVSFTFVNDSHSYSLQSISLTVFPDKNFTNASSMAPIILVHNLTEFNVTSRKSYKCITKQTLNLTHPNSNKTFGQIVVSDLQLQAFNKDNKFLDAVVCQPLDTPDIIPIAAGIALGILIAFVLIGYLVGRRRSQARGYLSM